MSGDETVSYAVAEAPAASELPEMPLPLPGGADRFPIGRWVPSDFQGPFPPKESPSCRDPPHRPLSPPLLPGVLRRRGGDKGSPGPLPPPHCRSGPTLVCTRTIWLGHACIHVKVLILNRSDAHVYAYSAHSFMTAYACTYASRKDV